MGKVGRKFGNLSKAWQGQNDAIKPFQTPSLCA
jgi:hypothetical protein